MKKKLMVLLLSAMMLVGVCSSAGAAYMLDLPSSHWAYDNVSSLVDVGIMEVDQQGYFYPDVGTTRGEFVLYLYRTFGEPYVEETAQAFRDVDFYNPFYEAVQWCYYSGITTGVGNGQFDLYGYLTREMAFTFLYRAMDCMGVAPVYGDGHEMMTQITEFKDYNEVHAWAADSIQLLLDVGVVRGGGDYLWPRRDVNNVQTAALLTQYLDYVLEFAW